MHVYKCIDLISILNINIFKHLIYRHCRNCNDIICVTCSETEISIHHQFLIIKIIEQIAKKTKLFITLLFSIKCRLNKLKLITVIFIACNTTVTAKHR